MGSRADGPGPARDWTPSFFERVAAMGLAMASVDYRLSGEARWPAQLEDVDGGRGIPCPPTRPLGVPTPRTVAWGVSAGGQLAAMHALCSPDAGLDAVVCWYPPTDLDALAGDCDEAGGRGERGPQARESQLLGAPVGEHPDLAAAASPVRFAHPHAPPFLFLHGTADTLVPPRQSQRLADALTAAGAQATVELVDGAGHMFPRAGRARDDEADRAFRGLPVRHDHVGINVADLAQAEAWYPRPSACSGSSRPGSTPWTWTS